MKNEIAVFGGGCFWCTEAVFKMLKGVISVIPGYAGGGDKSPNYESVSSGVTGHAEVIKIEFDSVVISFEALLEVFFHVHDPTTINGQGADTGTQYRSIVLYTNDVQKEIAERLILELGKSGEFKEPIVTEVKKLDQFYEAEDYHKDYYARNSYQPYCQVVISPKLQKLREKYGEKLR